jgi:hypothetical protein
MNVQSMLIFDIRGIVHYGSVFPKRKKKQSVKFRNFYSSALTEKDQI